MRKGATNTPNPTMAGWAVVIMALMSMEPEVALAMVSMLNKKMLLRIVVDVGLDSGEVAGRSGYVGSWHQLRTRLLAE